MYAWYSKPLLQPFSSIHILTEVQEDTCGAVRLRSESSEGFRQQLGLQGPSRELSLDASQCREGGLLNDLSGSQELIALAVDAAVCWRGIQARVEEEKGGGGGGRARHLPTCSKGVFLVGSAGMMI